MKLNPILPEAFLASALVLASLFVPSPLQGRERKVHIIATGDVHSSWFSDPYVDGSPTRSSLMAVKHYADSLRSAAGEDNVILLDAGDCLQGDNAAYYYNYVDTVSTHLFPRLCAYMAYDALVVGNHDIETGHAVYDRVNSQLLSYGIPWLGGNALRTDNSQPYFPYYTIVRKAGLKVAVLGFTNPNMRSWLSEAQFSGMDFVSLLPFVQDCVNEVLSSESPDIVIVAVHSGTGDGKGRELESQGLDLLESLEGVDVLLSAHDHRPYLASKGNCHLANAGARAGNVAHLELSVEKKGRSVRLKDVQSEIVSLDRNNIDSTMYKAFRPEYEAVKAFTLKKVGELEMDMRTSDAYRGMSDYINLIHTAQLSSSAADISFAAPLTFDGRIKAGELVFNDMFTIYPYENQMFVVRMKGSEIKSYLEYSYDTWIQTPGEHILKMVPSPDPRTGTDRYSFVGRSYNFDSAAGLVYTVDVTKPAGERVCITSLADGRPFRAEEYYKVAMTSYRANGGGALMERGAGIADVEKEGRVVGRYPEIRNLIYDFISSHASVDRQLIGRKELIGQWRFVPEDLADRLMEADMQLLLGK